MVYLRHIALEILDGAALNQQKIKTLYEGKLVSSGRCGSMPAVFGSLVDATFQK
jgi:hypothetical protein